jgi:hypothetical protein
LFGTYEPEIKPVQFGITKNIRTYNPVKIIFHEFIDWLNDLKNSRSAKEAFDHTFLPPR